MTISIDLDEKQIKSEPKRVKILLKKDPRSNFTADTEKLPVKKSKPKKKINWKKIIIISVVTLLVGALAYGGYYFFKIAKDVGFNIKPSDLVSGDEPELERDSTGEYTSILIVGVDTRETGGSLNTDSIIVATFMYDTNELTMVSIPRDFSAETSKDSGWYNKVNGVYARAEAVKEKSGLNTLEKTVEEITDIEIQYYAMVNFDAFIQIIDSVGGVTINVEDSFTDNCYPSEEGIEGSYYAKCIDSWGWWKTISFPTGVQTMDGETALEYARSRHADSDYMRAKRQQQVIDAVKDAISSSETYTNAQKLLDLISAVSDNLTLSEFTINDIKAAFNLMNDFEDNDGKTYSFVLEPTVGNSQLVARLNTTEYMIGPKLGLGDYTDIHDFIAKVLVNPGFYEEDASIYVYDIGLGYQNTYAKTQDLQERYPYSNIQFMGSIYSDKEGVVIYEHESGSKPSALEELKTYLNPNATTQPEYITTNLNGEDISILFGKTITVEETTGND